MCWQGWAFFHEYEDARVEWAERAAGRELRGRKGGVVETVRREVEFNRARCWLMLGMAEWL